MNGEKTYSIRIGDREIKAQFNNLAEKSHGGAIVSCDGTVVLVTAVMSEYQADTSFFPLRVDFEDRFYASGNISGNRYSRREGKPSDRSVLTGRVVDRTIRPLFDTDIRNEIQVVITVLSRGDVDPVSLSVIGASLALASSDIPWNGPIGVAHFAQSDGKLSVLPNEEENHREIDVVVCGKGGLINMIEVGAQEQSKEACDSLFTQALEIISELEEWQKKIIAEIGKEKRDTAKPDPGLVEDIRKVFANDFLPRLESALFEKKGGYQEVERAWREYINTRDEKDARFVGTLVFEEEADILVHTNALNGRRPDGRGIDEVRTLYAQVGGISDRLHGTGIFFRGETHVMSITTLGSPSDQQSIEGEDDTKRFFHHYNFPPYSTGEVGRIGSPGRREIGHGALAEKAIEAILPSEEQFPYTIRVVSEVLSSNGSTSQASMCATSLSLMDAGVPISRHVAGIAIGLAVEQNGDRNLPMAKRKYALLTDIQGPEDHHGGMDFKVAGTREGIVAIQLDVKVEGITLDMAREALERGERARAQILDVMEKTIDAPRADLSPRAPRIQVIWINPEKIGLVIGPGGKMINGIRSTTGAEDIQIDDNGKVVVAGEKESVAKAVEAIQDLVHEYTVGEKVTGVVSKILEFGAVVELKGGKDGLVHISEISDERVEKISDFLKLGDEVPVIIKEIDERGRMRFSLKDARRAPQK